MQYGDHIMAVYKGASSIKRILQNMIFVKDAVQSKS